MNDVERKESLPDDQVADLPLWRLSAMIRTGEITSRHLVEIYLDRIGKYDGPHGLNAYITVAGDSALKQADRLDKSARAKKFNGPLHGIPVAVKDNIDTEKIRTTGGTKILADWYPPKDAHVVRKLKAAGAIILGKTNLNELAFGVTTNNYNYGQTRNPYDFERIPGGSSGGSAAATAAALCAASIGSDTGGSVRIPAALCNLVGLKPTLGRVGRTGLIYNSFSRDVIGPITRTVTDAAMMLEVMSGPDPTDLECRARRVPQYAAMLKAGLKGRSFGVPRNFFFDTIHSDVRRVFDEAIREIQALGAKVKSVEVKHADLFPTGLNMVFPEFIYMLENYLGAFDPQATIDKYLDQIGPDVRSIIGGQKGRADSKPVPGYVYVKMIRETRRKMIAAMEEAMTGLDALLIPATAMPAAKIGEDAEADMEGKKVSTMVTYTRNANPFNVTGHPAITVPAGYSRTGLPIGLQIVGRLWQDGELLSLAYGFEQATKVRKPPRF